MRDRFALFLFLFLIPILASAQPKAWNALPTETDSATRAFPPQLRSELAQIREQTWTRRASRTCDRHPLLARQRCG
jgi:hypothetical protein